MAEPPGSGLIALDTNVFLSLFRAADAAGDQLQRLITTRIEAGWRVALPVFCLGEFWRAATREVDPLRADPETVRRFLDDWLADTEMLLLPGNDYWPILADLIERLIPSSNQIFDCQVLAVSIEHAVGEIWTTDSRFPADRRLRIVNPLAV